jgi:hypothetical protein
MKFSLFLLVLIATFMTAGASAQTREPQPGRVAASSAGPQAHMQQMHALLDRVNNTWKEYESATTPATKESALKAHGQALNEFNTAHTKMMGAGGERDAMKMCQEMMAKHKGPKTTKPEPK